MVGAVFWVLLSPVDALAQFHNHEGHHQRGVTSPFEVEKKRISLHCLIKLHTQYGYCPHSMPSTGDKKTLSIASDCGGKAPGALPNTAPFNYDFTEVVSTPRITNYLKSGFIFDQLILYHRLKDSISPPPKIIELFNS